MLYARLAIALAIAAASATAAWKVQAWRYGSQIAAIKTEQAQALQTAEKTARATEQRLASERQQVEIRYATLKRRAASDAAGADAALDSLRVELATAGAPRPGAGASAPRGADGDPRNDIIGECAAAAAALAQHADRLAAQVIGLQDYVGRVLGVLPVNPP